MYISKKQYRKMRDLDLRKDSTIKLYLACISAI